MAFVATLTGTGRNCTLTSGSNSMVVSSATGLVVGATIQGTGIPAGTRIGTISGTTVTMVTAAGAPSNATAAGTQSLIFSSVYGSILTIVLNASGDVATWTNVFNAGFGLLQGTKSLFHPGALTIQFGSIVAGARFDHQDWTVEVGSGGRMLFDSGLLAGEQRGGYDVAGSLLVKAAGPTFVFTNWNNGTPGGSSMFTNTGGLLTQGGTFRMHNPRFVMRSLNINAAFGFYSIRDVMDVENLILDYSEHAGANASIGFAYGTVLNPKIINANSGFGSGNPNAIGNLVGLQFLGIFTDAPAAKFAIQSGYVMEGYAPQVTNAQTIGGFQANSTETFANINLTTPGWGLNDLKTKYLRFGGPNTINFPRRVTFEFNDSAGANLTGVTLYIRSGSTSVINAVQSGDYSANTQALVMNWGPTGGYRVATTILDTIDQIAQVRRYGFIEQSTSYSLNLAPYSQPFFMLTDTSLAGINEAAAAAITTAGINWTTKTITPTANLSYDQINARIAWELAQTANSAQVNPRTISGDTMTLATGWSLVVNAGVTISEGTFLKLLSVPTVTISGGSITAIYSSSAGTSTIIELRGVSVGSSIYVGNAATGVTSLFQSNVAAGTYRAYFAPGVTAPQLIVREKYGIQREAETIPLTGGLIWYQFVDVPDVGISEATLATVQAYTEIENADKFYDRTAAFRLTEQGIKLGQLVTRDGTSINVSAPYSVLINQSAADVYDIDASLITLKATGYANGTRYLNTVLVPPATLEADTNEVLSADFEDANGDSAVTILGGDGVFELWKVTTATATADYETGVKLTSPTVGNVKFRFTGVTGFDIVGVDINSNVRRRTSMAKGVTTQSYYVGDQIQLAQAPQVVANGLKLDLLAVEIEALQDNALTMPQIEASEILAKEATVIQARRKAALAAALSA